MDLLTAMRVFLRVAETGSFTAVARAAGTTQPTVSKQIAALEAHLGTRLVERTTHSVALNDDGRVYLDYCRQVLDLVGEAEGAIGRRRAAPAGLVRVGSPTGFARFHLAPRIGRLLARHPELQIELIASDGIADLIQEGIDLAIRVGELPDQSMVARRIGMVRRVTVGSPGYFERHGVPGHPDELRRHNCIHYTHLAAGGEWPFEGPSGPIRVRVGGNYRANTADAVREGVLSGIGLAVLPVWAVRDDLAAGRVRAVLSDWEPKRLPLQAVWPSHRFLSLKVRALIDFLAEELGADPFLSGEGRP